MGFALTSADEAGWQAFATIVEARLTEIERASMAFAALRSQPFEHAVWTAEAAINGKIKEESVSFMDTPAGRQVLIEWREERDRKRRRAA